MRPRPGQGLRRRWNLLVRRVRESELSGFVLLCLSSLLVAMAITEWQGVVPSSAVLVPLVVGSLLLGPRLLPWFVVFALGTLVTAVASTADDVLDGRRVGGVLVNFIVGLVILMASFRRSRLGVAGPRGESMLVDLRERIHNQGRVPVLPQGWYVEDVIRSAGGSSFAGDFMVASRSADGSVVQLVVVDVSGKGEQAGTRSLLLSGAFGGLLGALPPDGFLPAANDYLLEQDWSEGFATAVHVTVDLGTGRFDLRSAGHPPALQLQAGSGRWRIHEVEGPVLGLIPGAAFSKISGTLERGDVLMLYTDGLVETPERDISLGIDRLLGQAERLLGEGADLGAERLVNRMPALNDDRALLLLHRRR